MREIVLDTETTGLSFAEGHRLVEIGCLELINHRATGKTYHVYINPERDMPEEAFRIHGLSGEFLADKPVFRTLALDFLNFIADSKLVIHNASFDIGFINAELDRISLPGISRDRVIDTLMLARRKFPAGPYSLDALCNRFGIDNSRRTKHGALLDSELLSEVYIDLLDLRQSALALSDAPRRMTTNGVVMAEVPRTRTKPLAPRLTEEDIALHAAFIVEMGDKALWKRFADEDGPA